MDPWQFLMLVTWTPPYFGMIFLALAGFLLGIVFPSENVPESVIKVEILLGVCTVLGLLLVASLPLVAIPLGLGFVGCFIGQYFRLKWAYQQEESNE